MWPKPSPDTSGRNDRIIDLWKEGKTSSEIARIVGVTRNTVIGVANRAQRKGLLEGRAKVFPVARRKPKPEGNIAPKAVPEKPRLTVPVLAMARAPLPDVEDTMMIEPALPPADTSGTTGVPLMAIKGMQCRAVLPHKGEDGLAMFCGQQTSSALRSFCDHHHALYYDKPERTPRKRTSIDYRPKIKFSGLTLRSV